MTASKTAFVVAVAVALAAISSEAFVAPGARLVVPTAQDIVATAAATRLYAATASGSGLDVIDSWKLLPDGRIQGVMAGSGDKVLTSPLKNQRGLKPDKTVRTVSGSRYKLGTPAVVANASGNANKGMSVAQMGTPRATQAGVAGGVRATQPLNKSSPTASQDRVLNEYVANKGRATMPLKKEDGEKKKPDFLTPLIAGASSIAVGAAIGTGVVTTKGIDLEKLPDPSKVLESTKSLKLPDIKALQAPAIPSPGISLPKFEAPKVNLPEVALPRVGVPELKLPGGGIKLPEAPDGVKNLGSAAGGAIGNLGSAAGGAIGNLGSAAGGAIGNALENKGVKLPPSPFAKKQVVTPIMEPYRVPMPYLDQKVVQAKKEAAEREEAARIEAQRLKEEEELYNQARERAQQEINAQQAKEREMALQQRAEQEARIRMEAEERVQKAEEEAAKLRTEVEQSRLALMEKEKAAAEEAARLKAEAAAALEKERAAKEEFTKKLQAAELAELQNAADFSDKLAAAQEAAVKERSLAEETATKQKLAEEAATREVAATEEVRKISVGATAARKASYGPKLGTYEAWQERQRSEYQTRVGAAATEMKIANRGAESPFTSPSTEKLSTYQKWQRSVIASQVTSLSADSVTAAYATGAPAPVANQLVSGSVKLSEAGTVLNGDLGYTIAGSAALVGGITYAYNYQRVEDELEQLKAAKPPPVSQSTVPPPPPPKAPPVVPATSVAKKATPTSVTMAIQSKEATASVTKPIPPPQPPKETAAAPEVAKPAPAVSSTPEAAESGASYLESMSTASAGSSTKTSYSPFSNTKKYVEPSSSGSSPQSEAPRVPDSSDTLVNGASYLDSMTGPKEGLKASYSPFGKPKATTNDSLYSAPAVAETQVDEPAAAIEEVPEAPVNGGGSYLDAMGGTGGASVKASYSPFGQPKATTNNDSLYSAPAVPESQPVSDVAPSVEETAAIIEELPEAPVNGGGSYLDSFGGAGGASVKASYSPFGQPKAAATNNDSLYSAPAVAESQPVNDAVPHVEEVPEAPVNGGGSYLDSMGGAGGTSVKASYSPFGSSKTPTQTQGDSLYGPPGTTNQESSAVETPATDDSGSASQGSYLEDLKSDSTGAPVKTSYSPFGTKPKAASDNTLYSPGRVHETTRYSPPASEYDLPSEDERDSTPVSEYLDRLIIPLDPTAGENTKKSYSPFGGNRKPKSTGDDPLYRSPQLDTSLPTEEERDNIPVTNYLQRLIVPLTASSSKKSFSPFGLGKWKNSEAPKNTNGLSYQPAEKQSFDLPSEEERDATPVANYLERLVVPLTPESSGGKKSFSPFGKGWKQPTGGDTLYKAPAKSSTPAAAFDLPSEEERDATPVANYLERLVVPLTPESSGGKKSFSPFGKGWKQPTGGDALYNAPVKSSAPAAAFDLPSEEERDATPVANYLERIVVPLTSESSGGKKSFSPFGKGWKQPTGGDTLYKAPAKSSTPAAKSSASAADFDLTSEEERDATPVGNYLERLVVPLEGGVVKTSYSPFGKGGKGSSQGNDDLYKPPAKTTPPPADYDLPSEEERDSTPVSDYLNRLIVPLEVAIAKNSYSPFGKGGKKPSLGNDSLYKPPSKTSLPPADYDLPSEEERDSTPVADYLNRLIVPLEVAIAKNSYSPFGKGKKKPTPEKEYEVRYEPPVQPLDDAPSKSDQNDIPLTDSVERLLSPSSNISSKSKKSYSPFGSNQGMKRKEAGSTSDALYNPPAKLPAEPRNEDGRQLTESVERLLAAKTPASESNSEALDMESVDASYDLTSEEDVDASYDLPSEEPDMSSEVEATTPATNYLEDLMVPTDAEAYTSTKKSYSPFGGGKIPKGSVSDSDALYTPPVQNDAAHTAEEEESNVDSQPIEEVQDQDTSVIAETVATNYLEALSEIVAPLKTSYSPFGSLGSKQFASSNTALYGPPTSNESVDSVQTSLASSDSTEDSDNDTNASDEDYLVSLGGSASPSAKNSFSPFGSSSEPKVAESSIDTLYGSPPEPPAVETNAVDVTPETNRVQQAYEEWCAFYGKEPSDLRFEIFSVHYKAVEKFHEENGSPLMLNEFSDLSEDEYKAMTNTESKESIFDTVVDDRIVSAYTQWCEWYGKDFSEDRLKVFASNFLILERYNGGESSSTPMAFNEYSDLTEDEYNDLNKIG